MFFGAGISSTGSVKDKEHKTLVQPLYASLICVSLCVPLLQVQVFGSFSTGLYLPTRCVIDHIYWLRTCVQAYWLGCTIHKGKSAIVYVETLNSTSTQNQASMLLSLLFLLTPQATSVVQRALNRMGNTSLFLLRCSYYSWLFLLLLFIVSVACFHQWHWFGGFWKVGDAPTLDTGRSSPEKKCRWWDLY